MTLPNKDAGCKIGTNDYGLVAVLRALSVTRDGARFLQVTVKNWMRIPEQHQLVDGLYLVGVPEP